MTRLLLDEMLSPAIAQSVRAAGGDAIAVSERSELWRTSDEALPAGVSDTFRRQVKAAGLPAIPLHNARHCHISHLLAAGEPIAHVGARAGHSTSAMTLRIYAHVIPGDDARTAARAAEMFEAS